MSQAYQVGKDKNGTTLTDLYDNARGVFIAEAVEDLFHKLTGNSAADIDDVTAYINSHYEGFNKTLTLSQGYEQFGSKVVTAKTLNANAGNPTYGIVLKLQGED